MDIHDEYFFEEALGVLNQTTGVRKPDPTQNEQILREERTGCNGLTSEVLKGVRI
jgi:hypothetical protein